VANQRLKKKEPGVLPGSIPRPVLAVLQRAIIESRDAQSQSHC
jgi:hypothetical protein